MLSSKFQRLLILLKFDNALQLLTNRILWPNRGPVVYELDGMEVYIDHGAGDQDGTRSCLVPGLYHPALQVLDDLSEPMNILDLGANGGGFLLSLRQQQIQVNQAVLVELNPHTWSRCVLNIYRNIPEAPSRVRVLNGAAGQKDGQIKVTLGRGSVGDSIFSDSPIGEVHQLTQYSFATLLAQFPPKSEIHICKIDIEGAEYDLFRNITRTELRRCKHLIIEIHEMPNESSSILRQFILDQGYRETTTRDKMIESNVYIFTREA